MSKYKVQMMIVAITATLLVCLRPIPVLAQHHHQQPIDTQQAKSKVKSSYTLHHSRHTTAKSKASDTIHHPHPLVGPLKNIMMSHACSHNLPMNRNGSGTSWLPDAAPVYGYMVHGSKWMYMIHGIAFLRYNNQDVTRRGSRGGTSVDGPNWIMAMGQRNVGGKGLVRFSTMVSLDPLTIGLDGYPLLFQSGESYKGKPLIDRQHPHDLIAELSFAYTG